MVEPHANKGRIGREYRYLEHRVKGKGKGGRGGETDQNLSKAERTGNTKISLVSQYTSFSPPSPQYQYFLHGLSMVHG